MKSTNKKALNSFAVAVLSMSMAVPSMVPAASVFAKEVLRQQIRSTHYGSLPIATPSETAAKRTMRLPWKRLRRRLKPGTKPSQMRI